MPRNILVTSIRNIFQNKLHFTINLIGLTIGYVALFFVANFIIEEHSYDKFNLNFDRISRLIANKDVEVSAVYGPLLETEFPEIQKSTRFFVERAAMNYRQKPFYLSNFVYSDHTVFDIFSINIIRGNPNDLKLPFTLFLTESTSKKIFGDLDPLGKTIKYDHDFLFTVKGIIEDIPHNSHLNINA